MPDPTPNKAGADRSDIDRLIAAGEAAAAHALLADLWQTSPDSATASFIVSRYEKLRDSLPMTRCRLAVLRSFTVEPILPLLRADAFVGGIDLEIHLGEFNAYAQEIIDAKSALYAFNPDAVILAVQTRDLAPDLWDRFADLDEASAIAAADEAAGSIAQLIDAFRRGSDASLIVHALQRPARPVHGILDAQLEHGQMACIERANCVIAAAARSLRNVFILDVNAIIARRGEEQWRDERKWLLARMPIAAGAMIYLARAWRKFLHPLTGRVAKALVVDLDNTLWGGVIGEDGLDGIRLGPEHPGAAWHTLQRAILDLSRRGVILAVCSKNNRDEAIEAMEKHPGMLLRPGDFAAMRINWTDKAANLREIAAELNIGVDALAFLDDNPFERQWVRSQLPEVTVIDLPDDPMGYAAALRDAPVFERLTVTDEDRQRGKMYAEQRLRSELEQTCGSLEDFYRSLQMRARVAAMAPQHLARTAQLTQKTNQFNLTTRRYTEQQVGDMAASPGWRVYTLHSADRFGDNGQVGVAIVRMDGASCEIDTFLMSCRVIGRTIETALLACIAEDARLSGADSLIGVFLPTKKNAPACEFYASHGFRKVAEEENGGLRWQLDLNDKAVQCPPWIHLEVTPSPITTTQTAAQ